MYFAVTNSYQPRDYSQTLYSQIPIKYLLQQARKLQHNYRDLYPPLLCMLVTYYPQLCLVEDWLCEEDTHDKQTAWNRARNLNFNEVIRGLAFGVYF